MIQNSMEMQQQDQKEESVMDKVKGFGWGIFSRVTGEEEKRETPKPINSGLFDDGQQA